MNLGTFTGRYAGGRDGPGRDGPGRDGPGRDGLLRVIILRQQKRATNSEAYGAAFP